MRVRLTEFQEALPLYRISQPESLEWLARAHWRSAGADAGGLESYRRRIARFACGPGKIDWRHHELEDFSHQDWERMRIFGPGVGPGGAGTELRMEVYGQAADRAFAELYPPGATAPGSILHVTCTGYLSPSPAQRLVSRRGWQRETIVTHAYHMGCYAAFPAIRMARGFLAAENGDGGPVDLVHTEYCTLHLDPRSDDPAQWVIESLFADGAIRYRMSEGGGKGLEVLALREELLPDCLEAMTWVISARGLVMTLSARVPELIAQRLGPYLAALLERAGLDFEDARRDAVFAIHPGGPRILDQLQRALGLADHQLSASREVLRARGNMSSATLPHVWKRILEAPEIAEGTPIVSVAFGPGLTMTGGVFVKR